jgi:hypothetical protein
MQEFIRSACGEGSGWLVSKTQITDSSRTTDTEKIKHMKPRGFRFRLAALPRPHRTQPAHGIFAPFHELAKTVELPILLVVSSGLLLESIDWLN